LILHWLEQGEPGDTPPLVLLHGLFGRAGNFGAVQRRLAAHRRVLALDLRNHGASAHDPAVSYDIMAADVVETLRAARAWPGVVLGHSMGGKVAMRLASGPEAGGVAALIVADIAPVPYPPHFRTYAEAMLALPMAAGLTRAAADAALSASIPDRGVRAFLLQNMRAGADPGWTCGLREIAAALPAIEDFPAGGAPFARPTLVLSGARSDYVRPEHEPMFRHLLPEARFVVLPDAGHWLHAEDPDGFVAAIEAFLGPVGHAGASIRHAQS
jgi:pimeloyl-ACP methyl ester carboxylesterase